MSNNLSKAFIIGWLIAFFVFPVCVHSQDTSVDSKEIPKDDVTSVDEGNQAPFDGYLVREPRFIQMLQTEIDVKECQGDLKIEMRKSDRIEESYLKRIQESVEDPPFYNELSFNRWVFYLLGVFTAYGMIKAAKGL